MMFPWIRVVICAEWNGVMGLVRGRIRWYNLGAFNVASGLIELSGLVEFRGHSKEGVGRWQAKPFRILDGLGDAIAKEAKAVDYLSTTLQSKPCKCIGGGPSER